jgi:uncharacterized membrane protein YphA (DoxX/SURF4 family)
MSGSTTACPSSTAVPERRSRVWAALTLGCRLVVAAVFLMAALTKIQDLPAFRDRLTLHSQLTEWIAGAAAEFIPWLELTCGFCLLLGVARREAAVLAALLLIVFTAFLVWRGQSGECGCFLLPVRLPWPESPWLPLARNLIMLFMCIVVAFRRTPKTTT